MSGTFQSNTTFVKINTAILAFLLVFQFIVYNIYFANIYYIFMVIIAGLTGELYFKRNYILIVSFLFFMFSTLISMLLFNISFDVKMDPRIVLQFIFNLQYILFIMVTIINIDFFEKQYWLFSAMLAIYIIIMFFYLGKYSDIAMFYYDRDWLKGLLPVYSSTTIAVPLLVGFWFSFKNITNYKILNFTVQLIFLCALFLTTSRAAILGGISIIFYFIFYQRNNYHNKIFSGLFISSLLYISITYLPSLYYRAFAFYDRANITQIAIFCLLKRLLWGYGGNTLNQIASLPDFQVISNELLHIGHTHNWILEFSLRYGIIGLLSFMLYILLIFREIVETDKRFLFLLLLFLALFQTYMRDFTFIFILVYLCSDNKKSHCFCVNNTHSNILLSDSV